MMMITLKIQTMATKVHELLSFCFKHGYYVKVVPKGYKRVVLDVVEPGQIIKGKEIFRKEPLKGQIGYDDKILEIYKKMAIKIKAKQQKANHSKLSAHGTRKV